MAKSTSQYVCQSCGNITPKWSGKCGGCGNWNSIVEQAVAPATPASENRFQSWAGGSAAIKPVKLKEVKEDTYVRHSSGIQEFDHVLGGGLVERSVTLIGGDPGIGKSTLLLQALAHYSLTQQVLYCAGEESAGQIKMRATRLGCDDADITIYPEVQLELIIAACQANKPDILVIDSIQTIYSNQLQAAPGSVSQVKECASQLNRLAKSQGISIFMIGHVTKDGTLAGPRVLEHIVDTVLYFEGDPASSFRLLRAIKNRFGAAQEIAVFAMTDKGLQEVNNPSSMFLSTYEKPVVGSCITTVVEGSRPLLVEVQALVETSTTSNPKRYAEGVDVSRVQMLLAAIAKYLQITTSENNVYINVVGGVSFKEPAADLGVAIAAISSLKNKKVPLGWCFIGEIGLTGEVRPVSNIDMRIKEAVKLGFTKLIIPAKSEIKDPGDKISISRISRLSEAVSILNDEG